MYLFHGNAYETACGFCFPSTDYSFYVANGRRVYVAAFFVFDKLLRFCKDIFSLLVIDAKVLVVIHHEVYKTKRLIIRHRDIS